MSARSRPTGRRATLLLACIAVAGCASTPLPKRDWLSLHSEHYEIWSSLDGGETARLANELEHFRAGAEFIWGQEIPPAPVRTQVFAFDDRGVGRAYALGSERGYLLPRQRGDLIVLRAGGGWGGDAWTELELEYAQRLFWNASPETLPPWFEVGMPQLASTLESRGDDVVVGAPRDDHVRTLRDSKWIPFQRLLAASDLVAWSSLERDVFEAESWALCHYLVVSESRRGRSSAAFARFRSLLDGGSAPLEAARSAFGDEKALEREVFQSVRADALPRLLVPVPAGPPPVSRAVPEREILVELGVLSLAIGEKERALRYLERAVEQGEVSARTLAALGDALEAQGDTEAADLRYQAALAAAPDDPIVQLGYAQLLRSRAAATADPARRAALVASAREHYQRATLLEPDLPEAWSGLAATHLLDGEEPASGLAPIRAARRLRPGDTGIGMLEARIALAAGDSETARREAARQLSRASTREDLDAARLLLEQIDAHAASR